jgi:ATP-binding cassette, subfamily B (MDR/TAP), member 1
MKIEEEDEGESPNRIPEKEAAKDIVKEVEKEKEKPEEKTEELTEEEKKKKEEEELLKKYEDGIFGRLFSYASDKKCLFLLGFFVSVINGCIFPVFSIFLSKMLAVLVNFNSDSVQARTDANLYALLFLLIGIASFILNIFQQLIFSIIGEEVTRRVRN